MLTQFISRPSRLAISLPSSMRIPWRLPFSSMYWTGGRVALVATTSLPDRTTAGGVTTGEAGYLAACAFAAVGSASRARAIRNDARHQPRLRIALPPLGSRGVNVAGSAGRSTTALTGQKAPPIYHESSGARDDQRERSARRSAGAERGEGGFEDRGLFVGERGGAEAAALVGGGEASHRGGRGRNRRLHAAREFARRLGGTATVAAPGEEALTPRIEARHPRRRDAP